MLLLVCSLVPVFAKAQFSDSVRYFAGFNATGSLNKTNATSAYLLNNAVRFDVKRKDVLLNADAKWVYGNQDKQLTNNDYTANLNGNLYKSFPHFYYWGLFTYTSSYSLKINNQFQEGLGVAYDLLDKEKLRFNISDGILYENSDIYTDDTTRTVYFTFRNSLRMMLHASWKDIIIFNGSGFLQNSLNYSNDYILKGDLGLDFKLRKWLSLTTHFVYNKISRTEKENALFTYGFALQKYF